MKRGEVWWADLKRPAGRRPVVLLTRDAVIESRRFVTVAPITSTVHHLKIEVPLGRQDGLLKPCVVNADSLVTIEKSQLLRFICDLPVYKMTAVSRAVRYALALG